MVRAIALPRFKGNFLILFPPKHRGARGGSARSELGDRLFVDELRLLTDREAHSITSEGIVRKLT